VPSAEIIYGTNPVLELLRAGRRRCHEVFIASGLREARASEIMAVAESLKVPVKRAARAEIGRLARTDKHQGVAARCDPFPYSALQEIVERATADPAKGFVLLLDGIADPQNLGSLIRTAHLMGLNGVVIPRDNAAHVTPAAVKASAGAAEHMPVAVVTNIARTLLYMKEAGFWAVGADAGGDKSLYSQDFRGYHLGLVIGGEGGMRRLVRSYCDILVRIPMKGILGSYNASVAGALMMGEIARQRGGLA